MFHEKINYFQEKLVNIIIVISYLLIIASFLGLSKTAPQYLNSIEYYFRIYICLFLIWRFNPFRQITTFTNLDRKIVFSAGLFILTTSALNQYLLYAKNSVDKFVKPKLLS